MVNILKSLRLGIWVLVAVGASGCAGVEERLAASRMNDAAAQSCVAVFRRVDQAVAPVADAETVRIAGFPYLRINRLLASHANTARSGPAFNAWVGRMRALARTARSVELANLPTKTRHNIKSSVARLEECARLLQTHDLADDRGRQILRDTATVPDHYNTFARVAGLYPLTSVPIWLGYKHLRRSQQRDFKTGLGTGKAITFAPKLAAFDTTVVGDLMRQIKRDKLGLPVLSPGDRELILNAFAPVYRVGYKSRDDRIGLPVYTKTDALEVDVKDPVVFRRIAFTQIGNKTHLQLVYTAFFPARTSAGPLDLFAGNLDGLIWRVTLNKVGRPIIYDSIHPCGCYHLFFPARPQRLKPEIANAAFGEPPLAPTPGPVPASGQRIRLLLKPGTHYLAGVELTKEAGAAKTTPYRLVDENVLRSLPTSAGNRRSLYGPDGIVVQSARPERFLLWSMGVASAGAMRQWGGHATAFIGRRHFDDPFLFDKFLTQQ
ncbi:MAG: hypothetical protein HN705_09610 [Rhodospirillales bacterium]|nr:hypothetical protein [Rhodospirillales bacterium]